MRDPLLASTSAPRQRRQDHSLTGQGCDQGRWANLRSAATTSSGTSSIISLENGDVFCGKIDVSAIEPTSYDI
nr:hypothetical protein Itr_chr09CG11740 [Ipomoea trifida]